MIAMQHCCTTIDRLAFIEEKNETFVLSTNLDLPKRKERIRAIPGKLHSTCLQFYRIQSTRIVFWRVFFYFHTHIRWNGCATKRSAKKWPWWTWCHRLAVWNSFSIHLKTTYWQFQWNHFMHMFILWLLISWILCGSFEFFFFQIPSVGSALWGQTSASVQTWKHFIKSQTIAKVVESFPCSVQRRFAERNSNVHVFSHEPIIYRMDIILWI